MQARSVRTMRSYASTACAQLASRRCTPRRVCATWIEPGPNSSGVPQRLEQRDVGRVGDGRDVEAVDGVEVLRGDVRAPFELGAVAGPRSMSASRTGATSPTRRNMSSASQSVGDDVRLGAAANRADVDGRLAEDRIGRQRAAIVTLGSSASMGSMAETAEVRVRGVRVAAARADDDAQRALRARSPACSRSARR